MKRIKTEHAGAKNGGGYWGKREQAKRVTKSLRRIAARAEERAGVRKAVMPKRYRLVIEHDASEAVWKAHVVEKPLGVAIVAEASSLPAVRARVREALATVLGDEWVNEVELRERIIRSV